MIRHAPPILFLLLAAGPAFAANLPAERPTATAAVAAPGDVAEQIAAYLRDSPVAQLPAVGAPRAAAARAFDRRPHGVIEAGVGSHGYRSVYLQTDIPLGDNGMLSLGIGQRRGGWEGLEPDLRRGPSRFYGAGEVEAVPSGPAR